MIRQSLPALAFLLLALVEGFQMAGACTDFRLKTADGDVVIGRSTEFAMDLKSQLAVCPGGEKRISSAPGGRRGLAWKAKYGFVAANALGLDVYSDGLNEAGLSVGLLWLPGTKYQEVAAGEENKAIEVMDLTAWMLGNFSTVAEVKEAIRDVRVWGAPQPKLGEVPPVHVSIHDAGGKSLVIEFIDGQQKVYDNRNGVLTNYPTFDWQLTNLKNYVNLTAQNATAIKLEGIEVRPTGQGSGWHGIPGDWTPPSRFVRISLYKHFAKPAGNAAEAVNLADHLLNTVDIPKGTIRDKPDSPTGDYTQWVVIKDLRNKILYFRTYGNGTLQAVDLKKLNLGPGARRKSIPMASGTGIVDATDRLR